MAPVGGHWAWATKGQDHTLRCFLSGYTTNNCDAPGCDMKSANYTMYTQLQMQLVYSYNYIDSLYCIFIHTSAAGPRLLPSLYLCWKTKKNMVRFLFFFLSLTTFGIRIGSQFVSQMPNKHTLTHTDPQRKKKRNQAGQASWQNCNIGNNIGWKSRNWSS